MPHRLCVGIDCRDRINADHRHCDVKWPLLPAFQASDAPFPSVSSEPGVTGVYPDRLFDALVEWVETSKTPERVLASQKLANGTIRTRPLCAFPEVAKWNGQGDPNDAASFECVDGQQNLADFTTKFDRAKVH